MIIPKAKDIIEQEFMKLIFLLFFFISSCLSFSSTALTEHTVSLFWLLTIQLYLFSKFVTEEYLKNSLDGIQKNTEVISLITYFDYLKSSDNPKEKKEGEFLFETIKKTPKPKHTLQSNEFLQKYQYKILK